MTRWRHLKRGSTYRVLASAELQSSGGPVAEGATLVVYEGEDDGKQWARPRAEFQDGRFAPIAELECAAQPCVRADLSTCKSADPSTGRRILLAGPEPLLESLTWRDVTAGDMPADDRTVLLWVRHGDGKMGWDRGWWAADEKVWRLCESGGECAAEVLCWAQPEGPQ